MPHIQYRHKCSVCGRDSAVKPDGTVANHGYTLDFHYMQGQCWGSNLSHFGKTKGLEIAADMLLQTRKRIKNLEESIPAVKEPTIAYGSEHYLIWSHYHRMKSAVRFMKRHVDSWVESEPREVEVK